MLHFLMTVIWPPACFLVGVVIGRWRKSPPPVATVLCPHAEPWEECPDCRR